MPHLQHLQKDAKLKKIIAQQGELSISKRKHIYLHLISSIMSQQLSTSVARTLHNRFLLLFNHKTPSLQQILDLPFDTLRGIGLSHSKTNYIFNVARFFSEEKLTDAKLHKMDNEAVIDYLTRIKGVGRWTVEMLLMFSLARPDVFALDDLGIQQAMTELYQLDASDKKQLKLDMEAKSKKWIPYRTYACMYLWRYKDAD
jgi:DNA-3-methyladenine glycosylase II